MPSDLEPRPEANLMPRIQFTPQLRRFLECPPQDVEGASVMEALERVFADNPRLEGYILDDQGELRRHVTVFVDGQPVRDRRKLSDAVRPESEVYVMQALSGGSEDE
jgi:molybdopterin synthase sulfur carrier subunit